MLLTSPFPHDLLCPLLCLACQRNFEQIRKKKIQLSYNLTSSALDSPITLTLRLMHEALADYRRAGEHGNKIR